MIALYRVGFGGFVLAAIAIQFVISFRGGPFSPVNFFSYFTILSNIYGGALLLYCGVAHSESPRVSCARGAAFVYLAITGIVYSMLLANEPPGLLLPWVNVVLHFVMPVVIVCDWLVDPPRHALPATAVWSWLLFPFVYLIYSAVRGAIVLWYPYPFLGPAHSGGYGGVAVTVIAIAAGFVAVSFIALFLGNRRRRTAL